MVTLTILDVEIYKRAGENPQKAILQQLRTDWELGSASSLDALRVKHGPRLRNGHLAPQRKAEESRCGPNTVYRKLVNFHLPICLKNTEKYLLGFQTYFSTLSI